MDAHSIELRPNDDVVVDGEVVSNEPSLCADMRRALPIWTRDTCTFKSGTVPSFESHVKFLSRDGSREALRIMESGFLIDGVVVTDKSAVVAALRVWARSAAASGVAAVVERGEVH
jgi:hypothetical protein